MSSHRFSSVAILPAFNEGGNISRLVRQFPSGIVQQIVVVSDGSTDNTTSEASSAGAYVIEHRHCRGWGPAVRTGIDFALQQGFDVVIVVAGNGKDDPKQVERLLLPIFQGKADFVQGSRYLNDGISANMPVHRKIGTQAYSFMFSCLSGKRITDATNGFRAFRAEILRNPLINIWQDWLNNYEVESYLFFQTIRAGYQVMEIGVSKIYPPDKASEYTKMRPFWDWWSHFRPALLLRLRIKR